MKYIKQDTKSKIRHIPKNPPSSSQIAENIKSWSTTGMDFGSPLYNPNPINPPVPIANSDCAT